LNYEDKNAEQPKEFDKNNENYNSKKYLETKDIEEAYVNNEEKVENNINVGT
jgi:hypothetical protein